MANKTGVKALTDVLATIVTGALGTQGALYGLVFRNSSSLERVVTLEHYRADTGETTTFEENVPPFSRTKWPSAFGILPGDTLRARSDIAGVKVIWSYDEDLGINPIDVGLRFVGTHSLAANYIANDVVLVNGFSYVALQSHTNHAPVASTVTAYWYPLTSNEMTVALGGGKLDSAGGTMTGPLLLAGDATSNMNPITKQQFDTALANVRKKGSVRVAATGNVTIATGLNVGDVVNGVTLVDGDLVLLPAQTTVAENGIYVAGAAPARFSEYDTYDKHTSAIIIVQEGTALANSIFFCTSNAGGVLGTNGIVFQQIPTTLVNFTATGGIVLNAGEFKLDFGGLADKLDPTTSDSIAVLDSVDGSYKQVYLEDLPVSGPVADAIAAGGGGGGGGISLTPGGLYGMQMSNTGGQETTHITISAGQCTDATNTVAMVLTSAIVKRLDLNWSVGSSNGGRDSGTVSAGQTWHLFIIRNPTSGTVDAVFSQSASFPVMPAGYTTYRRIGAVVLEATSTNIRRFTQIDDWFFYRLRATDYANTANGSGPYLRTLTVPAGIRVEAKFYFQSAGNVNGAATGWLSGIYDPIHGVPPAFGVPTQWAQVRRQSQQLSDNTNASYQSGIFTQFTNTNREVYTYSNDTQDTIVLGVIGWRDDRGRSMAS